MRTFLIALFALAFCTCAKAQNTFERYYDTLGIGTAQCVQETFDGGYVLCGASDHNNNDAAILKVDSLGNIQWIKIYGGPGSDGAGHIEQTADSGYIVYGAYNSGLNTQGWLLKLDANGDTIWTQLFSVDSQRTEPGSMTLDYNDGYSTTGHIWPVTGLYAAYLTKTNTIGTTFWSKTYSDTVHSWGYCVQQTLDSGYVITGAKYVSGSPDVFLIRTDSLGDTLWTKTYAGAGNSQGESVRQTTDSGYIITGFVWNISASKDNLSLIKTDSYGDTLWSRMYGDNKSSSGYCGEETSDYGYIMTGRTVAGVPLNADVWLIKTNSNGDTLWTKQFGGGNEDDGYFVHQTKDGGYIISGRTESFSQTQNYAMYLIKTDSLGNVLTTGISNPFCSSQKFLVYPNPGSGEFTIAIQDEEFRIKNVEVYNMLGEKIYADKINHTHDINISNQPDGIYSLKILSDKIIFNQKIIINH